GLFLGMHPGEVTFLPIAQGIVEVSCAGSDLARKPAVVLAGVTQELRKLIRNRAIVPAKGTVKEALGIGIIPVGNRLPGVRVVLHDLERAKVRRSLRVALAE